ncbi:MAG TPA: hypothetical protein VLL54_08420 [Pyrinomonadaceae bacterium]|nr:hypothetical protein [Pyrinomonadaceae bacterium]
MSTELDHAREIAERIARRVAQAPVQPQATPSQTQSKPGLSTELAAVRAGLNDLQRKISQLEAKLDSDSAAPLNSPVANGAQYTSNARAVPLTHSPWLAGVNASISHPSQERFGVEEAVVSELVDYFEKEKTCGLEPGKPCDHCAMCSSRGF